MRCILPLLLLIGNSYAAEVKSYQNVKINILDKIYNKRVSHSVKMSENVKLEDLAISVTKCIQNTQNYSFALVKVLERGKEVYNEWVPINEIGEKPFEHKRYNIQISSCY